MMTTTEEVAPTVVEAAVEEVAAATIAPTKGSQPTCCTLCIYEHVVFADPREAFWKISYGK
jgi:hypothetical protein